MFVIYTPSRKEFKVLLVNKKVANNQEERRPGIRKNDSQRMDRRTFIKSVGLGMAAILGSPAVVSAKSGEKLDPTGSAEKIDVFTHVLQPRHSFATQHLDKLDIVRQVLEYTRSDMTRRLGVGDSKINSKPLVFMPLHKTVDVFLSDDQFKKFY